MMNREKNALKGQPRANGVSPWVGMRRGKSSAH